MTAGDADEDPITSTAHMSTGSYILCTMDRGFPPDYSVWAHLFTGGLTQWGLTCLQESSHLSMYPPAWRRDRAPSPPPRGWVTSPFFSLKRALHRHTHTHGLDRGPLSYEKGKPPRHARNGGPRWIGSSSRTASGGRAMQGGGTIETRRRTAAQLIVSVPVARD